MKLKATKALTYNTRRLLPGDIFDARPRDARLLLAIRKAEAMREPVALAPPPPAVAEKIAAAVPPAPPPAPSVSVGALTTAQMGTAPPPPLDLAAARAEYERLLGKKPFNGWDVETLNAKMIAAAQSS